MTRPAWRPRGGEADDGFLDAYGNESQTNYQLAPEDKWAR